MHDRFLHHYCERSFGPFTPFTALPIEEARQILIARKEAGTFGNPDIEGFLKNRYGADKRLYDTFVAHGGQPKTKIPIYMMLGAHEQWASAYNNPAVIKIPLDEIDPMTVSFTYGDSFAVFNPALFGEEEYWNNIYFVDEMLKIVDHYGYPPYVEYDFNRGIYPTDKHINHHLKYVEAHIWDDKLLNKYREKWLAENPT